MSLLDILTLDRASGDVFVGRGPAYPWGGLYGGQIVAQGLRAACHTTEDDRLPHSLHAYFIRSGAMEREVRYEVERLRDGRSFSTRRVVARQGDEVLAELAVSFQVSEPSIDVSTRAMPEVPSVHELPEHPWSPLVERRFIPTDELGRAAAWMRVTESLGDDPRLQLAALTFLSDDLPTDSVGMLHPARVLPGSGKWPFFNASLDHTIHFHAPVRVDRHHLHDFRATRFAEGRGLSRGDVFDAEGRHVATIAQELLLRPRR